LSYPRTAILSDLHANLSALEVALADARERGAERYVCLGDVIGYGARPGPCLDLVMQLCTEDPRGLNGERLEPGLCLLGNHEQALLDGAEDFNPKARAAIDWTRDELNRAASREEAYAYWDFIAALEPVRDDGVAMFAHGSPRDPVREYMLPSDIRNPDKMEANFAAMSAGVCFVGHSHVPAIYFEDGRAMLPRGTEGPIDLGDLGDLGDLRGDDGHAGARGNGTGAHGFARSIVNVGSVGQPRDGDVRLSYALFDGRHVTFVRLEYDVAATMAEIRAVRELPGYLADRLAVGR